MEIYCFFLHPTSLLASVCGEMNFIFGIRLAFLPLGKWSTEFIVAQFNYKLINNRIHITRRTVNRLNLNKCICVEIGDLLLFVVVVGILGGRTIQIDRKNGG